MAKRTKVDFSKHKLKVTEFDGVLIHELKIPNSLRYAVTFINAAGVMTVTGDFGNWVFCREFHPNGNENSGVSDDYWDEKLEKHSKQKSKQYDKDLTLLLIDDFKRSFEEENQSEDECENDCDVESWISELKQNVDDEIEYSYILYRQTPNEVDCESLPYGEKRHVSLLAVYDAFDFICDLLRMENKNNNGKI